MVDWSQPDLPLFDPLEPRILPQDRGAWFTINRMTDGGMKQRPYRLELIETVLRALGASLDTYMSQGLFALPLRRAVHLAYMTHGYVDLDTYRSDKWRGLPPDEVVREILWFCADHDIPPPSVILFSGRGFYCKWFWSVPIPRAEAGRAMAVNRQLARWLLNFKADPCAVDVSRILRVVGTVNSKSERLVDIVWINGPPGEPTTYDFDSFAKALLPASTEADPDRAPHDRLGLIGQRGLMTWAERKAHAFSREHWHWGVLEDIRTLAAARYPGGIVQPGMRDLYGHLAACQLARVIMPGPLFHEITATVRTFLPSGYVYGELRRHSSSLLERAMWAAEGQMWSGPDGRTRTPIYTYSKARIMDLLEITPDDERGMTRLISDAEKERRRVERRRAAGIMERAEYEARAAERRPIIATMRASGMTWRAIATELDISEGEARRLARTGHA